MPKRKYKRHYDTGKLLRAIIQYKLQYDGNSPTLREMGELMDINSTSTIRNLLADLVTQGKISTGSLGETRKIMVESGMWLQLESLHKYLFELGMDADTNNLIIGTLVSYKNRVK